jgi:hypothetical protein
MNTPTIKVYRARKTYRNGERIQHFVIVAENPDDIEWMAEDIIRTWADRDPAGQNYGYDIEWDVETNQKLIDQAIAKDIMSMEKEIERLQYRFNIIKKSK